MSDVRHYLLTRFNVASPGREQAIRLKPGWLEGRFQLFRDMCLPSVADQTRQDFTWIVFFDEQTPAAYRDEIVRLQAIYPFEARFTGMFEMDKIVPSLVANAQSSPWLLTTRLDSDDILAVDHMERLHDAISDRRPQAINFRQGAILSIKSETPRLYVTQDDSNPFASLLEPMGDGVTTIWGVKHVEIERLAPVTQIDGAPAWLQVVHGANVSNRVKGKRVPLASLTDVFPYLSDAATMRSETALEIGGDNALGVVRSLREAARATVKPLYHRLRGL